MPTSSSFIDPFGGSIERWVAQEVKRKRRSEWLVDEISKSSFDSLRERFREMSVDEYGNRTATDHDGEEWVFDDYRASWRRRHLLVIPKLEQARTLTVGEWELEIGLNRMKAIKRGRSGSPEIEVEGPRRDGDRFIEAMADEIGELRRANAQLTAQVTALENLEGSNGLTSGLTQELVDELAVKPAPRIEDPELAHLYGLCLEVGLGVAAEGIILRSKKMAKTQKLGALRKLLGARK